MRVVDRPFFYPGSIDDAVGAALNVAKFYGCDPFTMLDREPEAVLRLYDATLKLIEENRQE